MHEVMCTRWKSVLWLLHLNDRLPKLCSYRLLPRTSSALATIPAMVVWLDPRISHRRAMTPLASEPMRKRQLISLISMAIFSYIRGCLHSIRKNQLVHKVINHFEVLLQLSLQSNVQKLLDVPEHIDISLEYHGVKVTKSLAKTCLEPVSSSAPNSTLKILSSVAPLLTIPCEDSRRILQYATLAVFVRLENVLNVSRISTNAMERKEKASKPSFKVNSSS